MDQIEDTYPDYETIVARWGYHVVSMERFGSYQGDIAVLLKDGDQYGWLVIGYGSCGGCDALEDAMSWTEPHWTPAVYELADRLKNDIRWSSASDLAAWLTDNTLQESKWSWFEPGFKEHVTQTVTLLADHHEETT